MTNKNPKVNLSPWDAAVDFTGEQAAALAHGHDPAETGSPSGKKLPLFQRMESCYNSKKDWLWGDMGPHDEESINAKPDMLESVSLREWAAEVEPDAWSSYCRWYKDEAASSFEFQRFSRGEVARWLMAIQHVSGYSFDIKIAKEFVSNSLDQEKSLGKRERETLLKIVIGIAINGYGYTPNSLKSPAPKEIADDLSKLGLNVSDDTVRKYLREAVETVLPASSNEP